ERHAQQGRATTAMQRPSEGSHPPLSRLARRARRGGERTDRRVAASPQRASTGSYKKPQGRAAVVHRFSFAPPTRSDRGGQARRGDRAVEAGAGHRRPGPRTAERAADRGERRRLEADQRPASRVEGAQGHGDRRGTVLEARGPCPDPSTAEARNLTLEYRPQRIGVAVQDRFPRVRRIALSIKTEDFSRRTPAPDAAKTLRGEASDLNTIVTSSEGPF